MNWVSHVSYLMSEEMAGNRDVMETALEAMEYNAGCRDDVRFTLRKYKTCVSPCMKIAFGYGQIVYLAADRPSEEELAGAYHNTRIKRVDPKDGTEVSFGNILLAALATFPKADNNEMARMIQEAKDTGKGVNGYEWCSEEVQGPVLVEAPRYVVDWCVYSSQNIPIADVAARESF
jgi:hypothetical protein